MLIVLASTSENPYCSLAPHGVNPPAAKTRHADKVYPTDWDGERAGRQNLVVILNGLTSRKVIAAMRSIKIVPVALFSALIIISLTTARPAKASEPCIVTGIDYAFNGGTDKQLWFLCQDNNAYYINLNATNPAYQLCVNMDIESAKLMMSEAEAAELSGRQLTIYFTPNVQCQIAGNVVAVNFVTGVIL